jgi:hypothetical protein
MTRSDLNRISRYIQRIERDPEAKMYLDNARKRIEELKASMTKDEWDEFIVNVLIGKQQLDI